MKEENELFGTVAIHKNYLSPENLQKALIYQQEMRNQGQHKLIGIILLEMGLLSSSQLLDVLRHLEKRPGRFF